jgi:hypothetical protein
VPSGDNGVAFALDLDELVAQSITLGHNSGELCCQLRYRATMQMPEGLDRAKYP